ncbi:APC family permease [Ligilactobacillus cholophilus]|uniref:APC family permease n=1 Tax=Ligilactobacillus cholophilus TaxID=3050131 RepID=UPI0025B0F46D|nr:APC family permease [Ligilactobacillus cholophilus]
MTKDHKISPFSAFLLGVDGMVGSAIFLLPGSLYSKAGNGLIWLLVLSGISALFLALCYAALSSETKQNGAAWLYAYKEFGRFAGFEVGFFTWLQGVATISTETAAFLTSMRLLVPALSNKLVYNLSGLSIILIIAIIGLLGDKASSIADNIATFLKIGVLLIFIFVGIWFIHKVNFVSDTHYSLSSMNNAFSNAFYMYMGFAFLPVAAAQMKNPKKNLPRELVAVIVSVSLIYIATVFVAIGILGPSIAHSSVPLAIAFGKHFGTWGKILITIGTVGSVLGVAISLSFSTPYVASSLANEHHLLPRFFGKKSKDGSPYVAIIITTTLCMLLVLSGSYLFLVPVTIIISLVQYFSTSIVMFKKQWEKHKHPEKENAGSFNLRGGILVPSISILICLYILLNLKLKAILLGGIALLCGIVLYFVDKSIEKHISKRDAVQKNGTSK